MKTPRFSLSLFPLAACFAAVLAVPAARGQITQFVEAGDVWKYNDSGTIQSSSAAVVGGAGYGPTDWKHPSCDVGSWPEGNGAFGNGDIDIVTTLNFGPNASAKRISYYFRKEFTVANLNDFNALEILLRRDDGAVVYVNGREVARDNMPNGVVNQNSLAINGIGGADELKYFVFRVTAGLGTVLKVGTNVIAVQVHQNAGTSSDLSFDAEVRGTSIDTNFGIARPPVFTSFGPPETQISSSRHIRREVVDSDADLEWQSVYQSGPLGAPATAEFIDDVSGSVNTDMSLSWFGTRSYMETEPIDLRSFSDVRFSFDFRTYTEDFDGGVAAFEANDFARVTLKFSTDGVNFNNNVVIFESNGGGATGIDYTTLIASEAPKTAIVPLSAADPGDGWRDLAFDDSAWMSGTMGVGLEGSPSGASSFTPVIGIDIKEQMLGINESVFVRIPFTVNVNPANIDILELLMKYDDGFVAYINGTEVARDHAPIGAPAWDAGATTSNPDTSALAFQTFTITDKTNLLVQGQNILAIHGLNQGIGSSDMLILPELRIGAPKPPGEGSLGFYDNGFDGAFTTIHAPEGAIPPSAQSLIIRVEASTDGDGNIPSTEGIYVDDFAITGDPRYPDSYPNWILLQSDLEGDDGLPLADPDNDGLVNVLEYAFGGDPEFPDPITGPESLLPSFVLDSNGFLNITYRQLNSDPLYPVDPLRDPLPKGTPRRGILAADLRYVVEQSIDVSDWRTGAVGGAQLMVVGDPVDNGDERTVTMTLRSVSPIELNNPRFFWRLNVSIEPAPSYFAE